MTTVQVERIVTYDRKLTDAQIRRVEKALTEGKPLPYRKWIISEDHVPLPPQFSDTLSAPSS